MTESRWVRIGAAGRDRLRRWPSSTCRSWSSRSTPSTRAAPGVAADRLHAALVRRGGRQPARRRGAPQLAPGGDGRDRHRAGARHAGRARGPALSLLRPRDDLVPARPADRAARRGDRRSRCARRSRLGVDFGLITIIVGHATFCVVIAYNNVIARLRRLPRSPEEASADLGADTWTDLPPHHAAAACGTALLSGALLAFALSFDEIIVTNFTAGPGTQTIPLWILGAIQRPQRAAGRERRRLRPDPRCP